MKTQNGAAIRIRDIAIVTPGRKDPPQGQIGKATHRSDGVIVDNPDTVEGIVLLQKGDDSDFGSATCIHKEVDNLNLRILPGVKVVLLC